MAQSRTFKRKAAGACVLSPKRSEIDETPFWHIAGPRPGINYFDVQDGIPVWSVLVAKTQN